MIPMPEQHRGNGSARPRGFSLLQGSLQEGWGPARRASHPWIYRQATVMDASIAGRNGQGICVVRDRKGRVGGRGDNPRRRGEGECKHGRLVGQYG
jgi:hypothetical protein